MSDENIEPGKFQEKEQNEARIVGMTSRSKDKQVEESMRSSDLKLSEHKLSGTSRRNYPLRKRDREEQEWEEAQRPRHRTNTSKQDTPLDCYVKIIDYLKKIQWDEANAQNKMNPFHVMTPSCFWFMICAEYYSYNFYYRKNPNEVAHEYLSKVLKTPVGLSTRASKTLRTGGLLQFETEQIREASQSITEKLNHLIPAPLNIRNETYDRASGLTACNEDDQFRSSTRAWIYNYVKGKMQSSEKWSAALAKIKSANELQPRQVRHKIIQFLQDESSSEEQDPNALLFRHSKKKVRQLKCSRKPREKPKQQQVLDGSSDEVADNFARMNNRYPTIQQQKPDSAIQSGQKAPQQAFKQYTPDEKLESQQAENKLLPKKQLPQDRLSLEQPIVQVKKTKSRILPVPLIGSHPHFEQNLPKENQKSQLEVKKEQPEENQLEIQQQSIKEEHDEMSNQDDEQDKQKKNQKQKQKHKKAIYVSQTHHYGEEELLLQSILHLPLEKVISILQSILPKNTLPQIPQPFLPQPSMDPLQFIFQLHPQEEKYLEYMKENRSTILERRRKQNQKEKSRREIQEKQQQENDDSENDQKPQHQIDPEQKMEQNESENKQRNSQQRNCENNGYQSPKRETLEEIDLQKKSEQVSRKLEADVNSSMKQEQQEESDEEQKEFEDAKCQICTDGDYTDDNLIVFCSTCNISLHQRCVGLAKVPAESWVCEVCTAFGPAGINVPCPLCNVKGGALKRTNIHIDTSAFKESNPSFHQFTKTCSFSKSKEEYLIPEGFHQKEDQLYYDYFRKSTHKKEQKPTCHYVWCHYVCAIWVPECYFEQKNGLINIKGIQNIEKKRFKLECCVCKKTRAGACVKCEQPNCDKHYHPECARKKKVYMEQLNLEKLKYLIFCSDHQPLKLTRQIEYKKKKSRDQIVKFCRGIQKYVETYKIAHLPFKLHKNILTVNSLNNRLQQAQQATLVNSVKGTQGPNAHDKKHPTSAAASGTDDEEFIKGVLDQLQKNMMLVINLEKVKPRPQEPSEQLDLVNNKQPRYKVVSIEEPSRRAMKKSLNKYDEFWNSLSNGEQADKNYSRYSKIIKENTKLRVNLQRFLNGSSTTIGSGFSNQMKKVSTGKRRRSRARQTQIQEDGGFFCICRRPYKGETDMIECEICNQWYHFDCIGFIGGEDKAQEMEFHCMKCMKFEDDQQKNERMNKYKDFFLPNSLFMNYRPPTPELQSEDEALREQPVDLIKQLENDFKAMPQSVVQPQQQVKQKEIKQIQQKTTKRFNQLAIKYRFDDQNFELQNPFIVFQGRQNKAATTGEPTEIKGQKMNQDQQIKEAPKSPPQTINKNAGGVDEEKESAKKPRTVQQEILNKYIKSNPRRPKEKEKQEQPLAKESQMQKQHPVQRATPIQNESSVQKQKESRGQNKSPLQRQQNEENQDNQENQENHKNGPVGLPKEQ